MAEQGQVEEGIGQMRSGLEAMRSTGTLNWFLPYNLCLLAEGYRKEGQFRKGLAVLAEALAPGDKIEERFWEPEIYRVKGELLLLAGADVAEVEACFQHAIEVSRKQSAKSLELRAVMSLSRFWQREGRRTEARELLSHTYGWFTEGFDTSDLQAARVLLQELACCE
jgi:predicted ATPase